MGGPRASERRPGAGPVRLGPYALGAVAVRFAGRLAGAAFALEELGPDGPAALPRAAPFAAFGAAEELGPARGARLAGVAFAGAFAFAAFALAEPVARAKELAAAFARAARSSTPTAQDCNVTPARSAAMVTAAQVAGSSRKVTTRARCWPSRSAHRRRSTRPPASSKAGQRRSGNTE
jgi:hypothetical protein